MPAIRSSIAPALAAAALVLAPLIAGPAKGGDEPPPVAVTIEPARASIGNASLSIEFSTAAKRLRTLSIGNRITGATTQLEGEDFVILLAGGGKLKESELVLERASEEAADGGKGLAFHLAGEALRVRLRIVLRPAEWWATRWIEIEGGKGRLEKLSLSEWRAQGTYGPPGPGKTVEGLGYPQGFGQAAYVDDLFFAIEHPGAENFARGKRIACRIPACDELGAGRTIASRRFVVGAGEAGGAPQAFARFIGERRASPAHMVFLADGSRSKDKVRIREAIEALARVKEETGVPIDSFTLDDGDQLLDRARPAGMGLSLRLRPKASSGGIDVIEVEGQGGHPAGDGAAVARMDALIEAFAAWRKARPDIRIAYTSGSNPSPFWLEHADFVGRGGAVDEGAGEGEPFDRRATFIDGCLQVHRPTDMPVSAFAGNDMDGPHLAGTSEAAFERNAWWLAARTSLHHGWLVEASDLSPERWKVLARAARWAKSHERLFRLGRMVGGDPRQKAIYGFSAFEAGAGTLALRNPAERPGATELALSRLLVLPREAARKSYRLTGVYGETKALEGVRPGRSTLKVELPPLAIAVLEVKEES